MNISEPEEGIINKPNAIDVLKASEVVLPQVESVEVPSNKPEITRNLNEDKAVKDGEVDIKNQETDGLIIDEKEENIASSEEGTAPLKMKTEEEFENALRGDKGGSNFDISGERVTKIEANTANIESIPTAGEVEKAREGKKSSVAVMIFVIVMLLAIIGAVVYLLVFRKDLIGI